MCAKRFASREKSNMRRSGPALQKGRLAAEFVRDRTGGDIRIGDLTGDGQVDFSCTMPSGASSPAF